MADFEIEGAFAFDILNSIEFDVDQDQMFQRLSDDQVFVRPADNPVFSREH
jgi:hypothetical protein